MRRPNKEVKKKDIIKDKDQSNIIVVKVDNPIPIARFSPITTDKQRFKVIESIKRTCRISMEYKRLIRFLKENMNMDECEFFSGVSGKKKKGVIEIHHEPFDLHTICSIVANKYEKEHEIINGLEVASEVMKLHYSGCIGLIPLSVTAHQLVGDGKLMIPLNCVYGNFIEFVSEYYEYIDTEIQEILIEKMKASKNVKREDFSILDVKYVYTEVDGFNLPEIIPNKVDRVLSIDVNDNDAA